MALVSDLQTSIALHLRDTGNDEITAARLITFINDASQDASNSGWYIPIDDAAVTTAADDVTIAVPGNLVYIKEILDDANLERLERHYWTMSLVGGDATFVFYPAARPIGASKIHGWRRPTIYTAAGDTVDPGLESFLRDRAAAYALGYMAAGQSELDRTRIQSRELKMRDSESLLQRQPNQYKIMPGARYVPGR